MYPHTPPPEDYDNKYGGPIPAPPPGAPVIPRHGQHQHYPHYPATGVQYQPSHCGMTRWSTGLCHCCDDPANCMITCACPCITFGQIAEIVDKGSISCASSGTRYALLAFTGLACLFSCCYRSTMRAQYDLEEAPFADCLVHFLCETCALCQEYRELKNRDFDMGIGWEANMDRRSRGVTTAPGIPRNMTR